MPQVEPEGRNRPPDEILPGPWLCEAANSRDEPNDPRVSMRAAEHARRPVRARLDGPRAKDHAIHSDSVYSRISRWVFFGTSGTRVEDSCVRLSSRAWRC